MSPFCFLTIYLEGVFKLKGPWGSLGSVKKIVHNTADATKEKSGNNDESFEIDEEELEEERKLYDRGSFPHSQQLSRLYDAL